MMSAAHRKKAIEDLSEKLKGVGYEISITEQNEVELRNTKEHYIIEISAYHNEEYLFNVNNMNYGDDYFDIDMDSVITAFTTRLK